MKKIIFVLLILLSSQVFAKTEAMSINTFKRLQNIEDLMLKDKKLEAEKELKIFLAALPSRKIDQAYLYYTAGMYFLQEPAYSKVIDYLLKAYDLKVLPEKTRLYILQTLAGISMQQEKTSKAIHYYKAYIKLADELKQKPNKSVYLGLGTAYYYQKEYQNSIQTLTKAKALFGEKKSIYLMLFSSYYELKQYANAINLLEQMIRIWSDEKRYWMQLSSLYVEQKQYTKALEIMQLSDAKNFLTKEGNILQYTYVLYEKKLPYKGAKVLEKAIQDGIAKKTQKNYELLSNMYQAAKEKNKAIKSLKAAADLTTDGKNDLYIAQLYFEQENQFENVIKYAKKALEKGIKQPGNANMIIAVAYSELEQIEKAKQYLVKAKQYKKTKKTAQQWLDSLK
jgi:tetratricopeptide (TPR) repeat protein